MMFALALALAFTSTAPAGPMLDGETVFALLQKYHASFRDVSFLHEGANERVGTTFNNRFQTFYAYRNDGATLLDAFYQRDGALKGRQIFAVLNKRLQILNATPEKGDPIRGRSPVSAPGGPGSLDHPDSPERLFFAWYFPTLGTPAEHDFQAIKWEDVNGRRCLKARMLRQPKTLLKRWRGPLPYVQLWIDPQRDGYPVRFEHWRGEELQRRAEITRMERVSLPDGGAIWFPAEGKYYGFMGQSEQGAMVHQTEPVWISTHTILMGTVKFDQGLNDAFFSVKKHALVANDEGLRKLQRELDKKVGPEIEKGRRAADPASRAQRLDAALAEADRQAERLEASSAARAGAGWSTAATYGLAAFGVALIAGAGFRRWRGR